MGCELCDAAPITEWFHSDEECWIAECEACFVPMVVWRQHDPSPPDDVRLRLHAKLLSVIAEHFDLDGRAPSDVIMIDDHLRSIPDHYHAHARPKRLGGLRRR